MTSSIPPPAARSAREWLHTLDDANAASNFAHIYGKDSGVLAERMALLRRLLVASHEHLGDVPVRLFRAPGRINLRGMHVDTHGGYLNLMTHQREVLIAAAPAEDATITLSHAESGYTACRFDPAPLVDIAAFRRSWPEFLESDAARDATANRRGDWSLYAEGATLSIQHRFPRVEMKGLTGVIASDLPQGAALSSSAALCVACCLALLHCNGLALPPEGLIEAAQDAEWYTGSRCGIADQAAIVLGGCNEIVNAALQPGALDAAAVRRVTMPRAARILVVNSHTTRSISGPQQVAYTRNRFAYSMAVSILHQELARLGLPAAARERMRSFAALTPERIAALPGAPTVYTLLKSVPESMSLEAMRTRYELPALESHYRTWFGALPEAERPREFDLRGPLLFGLAESERARLFPGFLRAGDLTAAGRAMTIGHEGDRVVLPDGSPAQHPVHDEKLNQWESEGMPLWQCPGAYGASSPALDALVDAALEAGALGACLTGAGIAGTVVALCGEDDADIIAESVRGRLASADYAALAGLDASLTEGQLRAAVVSNHAPAGAGELAAR